MKIVFVLGARSDWGYIEPVIDQAVERGHHPIVWACNTVNLDEYGNLLLRIKKGSRPQVEIHESLTVVAGGTTVAMAKSAAMVTSAFSDFLLNTKPDWVVLAGDRVEQLGAAIASCFSYVPTAHIQAGERSGNIDGATRHAITRLAHLHFASNSDARIRLQRSGESDFRIVQSGAPQIDYLQSRISAKSRLVSTGLVPEGDYLLGMFHPETSSLETSLEQLDNLLAVLSQLDLPIVWIAPNNDAGGVSVRAKILDSLRSIDKFHVNLAREDFAGSLRNSRAIVGNSSAGILEAPTFKKPAVNVGRRQEGRFRGENVLDCDGSEESIQEALEYALSSEFAEELRDMINPYGDGNSARRVVASLEAVIDRPDLLIKQMEF